MTDKELAKARSKAYANASRALREAHEDEFYSLVCVEYDKAGLESPRPPKSVREQIKAAEAEVKRLDRIAKLQKQLAELTGE